MDRGGKSTVDRTSRKEFKTLPEYFTAECFPELSLDLIICGVMGEGLIQGHCGGKGKLVTRAAILISAECHITVNEDSG